jgi:radical SAM modification target selenobiotic family peptide
VILHWRKIEIFIRRKEGEMEKEHLKKLLAGLGIATLVAGAGLTTAGPAWAA